MTIDEKVLLLAKRIKPTTEWLLEELERLEVENTELRKDIKKWEAWDSHQDRHPPKK